MVAFKHAFVASLIAGLALGAPILVERQGAGVGAVSAWHSLLRGLATDADACYLSPKRAVMPSSPMQTLLLAKSSSREVLTSPTSSREVDFDADRELV